MTAGALYTASVHVAADAERVFEYFTRPEAIVRWMGDYAVLDPTPGGEFTLDINGMPVRGRYLEVDRPRRLLLSWGHAGSDRLPPGASTVEITFTPSDGGTTVTVVHAGLPGPEDRQHRLGWPHFLERLGIAAAGGDPGLDPWATESPAQPARLLGGTRPPALSGRLGLQPSRQARETTLRRTGTGHDPLVRPGASATRTSWSARQRSDRERPPG
jgi:uncharacterized protein YndB with AHSA1/START domain